MEHSPRQIFIFYFFIFYPRGMMLGPAYLFVKDNYEQSSPALFSFQGLNTSRVFPRDVSRCLSLCLSFEIREHCHDACVLTVSLPFL